MLRATTSSLYVLGPEEHSAKLLELREELRSSNLPEHGQQNTEEQLHAIAQAIPRSSVPDYFGFVTGGVTPISARADHLVTELDANVSVHLPDVSIATDVEDTTLRWLLQMFGFDPVEWNHRTLTTGATASNILGLACGRDFVIQEAAKRRNLPDVSVAELGLAGALGAVGVKGIRVLTTLPHSSLGKAASIVGLGRNALLDVSDVANGSPVSFNMELLDRALQEKDYLYIMSVSCSEVNTGLFATTEAAMTDIHRFCKQYGAWLHIDGAFGLMARVLHKAPSPFESIYEGVKGIELADSIAGDAHKLFNVPYDCGIFFSKHLEIATSVFQNAGAAYLASSGSLDSIASPLNVGIENSRRFRALPLYATLHTYGLEGYRKMLVRQISTARNIACVIMLHEAFELLPIKREPTLDRSLPQGVDKFEDVYIIVLFSAKDNSLNKSLVSRINKTGKIYVSGTLWEGRQAARIAVANWQVEPQAQTAVVSTTLDLVWAEWNTNSM